MRKVLLVLFVVVAPLTPAIATAPAPNDARADAREIPTTLSQHDVAIHGATVEPNENLSCLNAVDPTAPLLDAQSVWYRMTPSTTSLIYVQPEGANNHHPFAVAFFERGSELPQACGGVDEGRIPVVGGQTYDIQVSCACDSSDSIIGGRSLLWVATAPVNDAIEDAHVVSSLPYSDSVYLHAATADHSVDCVLGRWEGEPTVGSPLDWDHVPFAHDFLAGSTRNVWYSLVAQATETWVADAFRLNGAPNLNVFRRTPGGLELVACGKFEEPSGGAYERSVARFPVTAGTEYVVEVVEGSQQFAYVELQISRG